VIKDRLTKFKIERLMQQAGAWRVRLAW
jgi:hypothetical protein